MRTKLIAVMTLIYCLSAIAMNDLPLKPGDVVVSINGKPMKNNLVAIKTLNAMKKSKHVVMEVLRDGKIQKIVYDVK